MKGKTTIILRNVETGKTRVYEDENLITNALDKLININVAMNYALNSYVLPFATNALGGIMLFDGQLEEDADNIHFPAAAHLVGYAGQDVNTVDKYRGSYNAIESGKTLTGYISVWDFGTGQANGSIKAVARTSAHAGRDPLYWYNAPTAGSTSDGVPNTDQGWRPIRYDGEYVYMLKGNSETHVMRMARAKIPMLRMGVGDFSDVARSMELVASWSTLMTVLTYYNSRADYEKRENGRDLYVYADDVQFYEDGHDGLIYCMAYGMTGLTYCDYFYGITYFTVNYGDGSYDRSETRYLSNYGNYIGQSSRNMLWACRWYGHVHKGILYRISSNRKLIYKIPLNNPASYTPIRIFADDNPDYITNIQFCAAHEGAIYFEVYHYTATGYAYLYGVLYPDGTVVLPDYSYSGTSSNHGGDIKYSGYFWTNDDDLTAWGYYSSNSSGEWFTRMWAANYLGTINNLASEIVKTPAETMKIVYTLTDIDDEEDEGQGDDSGGDEGGGGGA